jgi:hypothetical protein
MPLPRPLVALAPALLFPALGPRPGDEADFHPAEHLVLTKTCAEELSLELDSFDMELDGEPVAWEPPLIEVRTARRATLADGYLELKEGRVTHLERTLKGLAGAVAVTIEGDEPEEHEASLASALEDAVVRFEWDDERGEYRRSFEEGGTGDDAHLAALEPEADFLAFLPAGPVEVDAAWDVDPSALGRVFAPGGDLRLLPSSLGDEPYVTLQPAIMLGTCVTSLADAGGDWRGTVRATYAGAAQQDGVRVGRIALELEVTASADLAQRTARALEALEDELEVDFSGLEVAWKLSGTGELLWDLAAGHVHAFALDGEVELEAKLGWRQPMAGKEVLLEGTYELSGTARSTLTLER